MTVVTVTLAHAAALLGGWALTSVLVGLSLGPVLRRRDACAMPDPARSALDESLQI